MRIYPALGAALSHLSMEGKANASLSQHSETLSICYAPGTSTETWKVIGGGHDALQVQENATATMTSILRGTYPGHVWSEDGAAASQRHPVHHEKEARLIQSAGIEGAGSASRSGGAHAGVGCGMVSEKQVGEWAREVGTRSESWDAVLGEKGSGLSDDDAEVVTANERAEHACNPRGEGVHDEWGFGFVDHGSPDLAHVPSRGEAPCHEEVEVAAVACSRDASYLPRAPFSAYLPLADAACPAPFYQPPISLSAPPSLPVLRPCAYPFLHALQSFAVCFPPAFLCQRLHPPCNCFVYPAPVPFCSIPLFWPQRYRVDRMV